MLAKLSKTEALIEMFALSTDSKLGSRQARDKFGPCCGWKEGKQKDNNLQQHACRCGRAGAHEEGIPGCGRLILRCSGLQLLHNVRLCLALPAGEQMVDSACLRGWGTPQRAQLNMASTLCMRARRTMQLRQGNSSAWQARAMLFAYNAEPA